MYVQKLSENSIITIFVILLKTEFFLSDTDSIISNHKIYSPNQIRKDVLTWLPSNNASYFIFIIILPTCTCRNISNKDQYPAKSKQ